MWSPGQIHRPGSGPACSYIARAVATSLTPVELWRLRFARSGRPHTSDDATVQRVLAKTLGAQRADASHWRVRWFAQPRQRRLHCHFTPTSASWMNMAES